MLGLRFQRLYGNLSACLPQPPLRVRWQQRLAEFNKFLTCNITVDVESVARTVWARASLSISAAGSESASDASARK